jgi:hypothetical protein
VKFSLGQTVAYQDHRTGERRVAIVERVIPGGPVTVDDLDSDGTPMQYDTIRVPTYVLRRDDGTIKNEQGRVITFPEHDLQAA